MHKTDIAKHLSLAADIPANKATAILDELAELATAELIETGEFPLPGLGKLKAKTTAARTARNPKTGEPVSIPERTVVKFTVAKALKDAVA